MDEIELFTTMMGSLKPLAAGAFLLYVTINRVFKYLDKRSEKKAAEVMDQNKEKRAEAFLEAMNNIAKKQEETTTILANSIGQMANELGHVRHGVATMGKTLSDLRDRQARVISKSESLAIVESKFHDFIRNEIIAVMDQSLRRNSYMERKNFVRDRVNQALSDIVTRAHESLERDYPGLDLDLTPFFPTRGSGTGAQRFTLVDAVWERIEPLYHGNGDEDIDQRVEDMRVAIATIVNDAVQEARTTVMDLYIEDELSTAHHHG